MQRTSPTPAALHVDDADAERRHVEAEPAPEVRVVADERGRPLLALWSDRGRTRARPVVDATTVAVVGEIALAAVVAARSIAAPRAAPRTTITMGPGGWVSFRGRPGRSPRRVIGLRRGEPRPWWAHLLRARRYS